MIISINWLRQFTEINIEIDELVALIGSRLVEVEAVIDLGAKYEGILIVDVKEVLPHPNADKLRVVHIDDAGANKAVARLETGLIEVVCGAPNVRPGMKVAWIPPGSTVPSTVGRENSVLDSRQLRGVVSNGMIASQRELGLGDDHEGILEIDKTAVPAGTSFAAAYELDDYLLDIENKSLTHRPDCFGLIGFAREVAAIQGNSFSTPTWLQMTEPMFEPLQSDVQPLSITAHIAQPEVSKRYQLVAFENVDATRQSPFAIQTWLTRVGIRPISAVVDITNYLMYITGQPLHAFDLDAVLKEHAKGKTEIIVRESVEGEKLALLDGRTVTLSHDDIVICAGQKPIALAGAMGGASTEITASTKRVLLESATFDLYRLRTTQMRHGIFSEAITRFTKGQMPAQTAPVLASAARMLEDIVGARRLSEVIDEYPGKEATEPLKVSLAQINSVLGTNFSAKEIAETLEHVEMKVQLADDDTLTIEPPYWRADIHIAEDIVEEVGRIAGFDNITPHLPQRPFSAVAPNDVWQVGMQIRQVLRRAGANEVLSYSFVPEKLLTAARQNTADAFRIVNAMSHDLQYYRLSLTPSLLEKVHPNIKAGFQEFALFEMGKIHNKLHSFETVPDEFPTLALVYAHQKPQPGSGAAFYQARCTLDYLATVLGFSLEYLPIENELPYPAARPYQKERSALVTVRETGERVGIIGEFEPSVVSAFKLPAHAAGFELGLEQLAKACGSKTSYQPLSRYPGTTRDITWQVAAGTPYAAIAKAVAAALEPIELDVQTELVGIYQKPGNMEKDAEDIKNVTLRLNLTSHRHTITAEEANAVMQQVGAAVAKQFGAEVV